MLTLLENGIQVEFIPGVTSAIGVPTSAGLPVTHRGVATSLTVVTGHEIPLNQINKLNGILNQILL